MSKETEEIREELRQKSDSELRDLIDEVEEKDTDRRPISNSMIRSLRNKCIAESILEDRGEVSSAPERSSASKGQQSLGGFA